MALQGIVASAAPGLIGFDSDVALNAAQANQYAAKGYRFCIRYVSRDDPSRAANQKTGLPDLSADEAAGILASGMALMAVQHVAAAGWTPSGPLGATYGNNAARYASDAGLPSGVNLWMDLEGIAPATDPADVIAYCNAWFLAAQTSGYVPGVYVGSGCILDGDALFLDLTCAHYWKSGSTVPDIAHRGYQLIQHIANPGTPQEFDRDVTQTDALGGTVLWLAPNG